MKKPLWTSTFVPASIFVWSLFFALLGLGFCLDGLSEIPLTAIVCLSAYVLGVPIGMAASPYREEGSHFKTIGGLVASFITGLAASKLAGLTAEDMKATFLDTTLKSGRSMLFLAFFVLGVVQTFMFRRYYDATRPRDQYEKEERPKGGK